ncbi:MAG: ABC transporter permease [Sphaerochaetaceae bacterium]
MSKPFKRFLVRKLLTIHTHHHYTKTRVLRSVLLIALVMIPLIVSLFFVQGMIDGISDKYITLQDGHIQIYSSQLPDTSLIPTVLSSDYVLSSQGVIYSSDQTAEITIKGIQSSYIGELRAKELHVQTPIFDNQSSSVAEIMLSEVIASTLGVSIGDRVALMLLPEGGQLSVRPLLARVTDIYNTGYYELDSHLVFILQSSLQRMLPSHQQGHWELLLTSKKEPIIQQVIQHLEQEAGTSLSWASWDQFNRSVYENFITSKQVIMVVFFSILIVAATYIASISNALVQDTRSSIAMYTLLGADSKTLYSSYMSAMMIITSLGLSTGIGIGIALSYNIGKLLHLLAQKQIPAFQYYLLDFSVSFPLRDIILITLGMIGITACALWLSLRKIRTITPLELLQQE